MGKLSPMLNGGLLMTIITLAILAPLVLSGLFLSILPLAFILWLKDLLQGLAK